MTIVPSSIARHHPTLGSMSAWASPVGDGLALCGSNVAAAAWPVANLAIAVPFTIDEALTIYRLAWENGGVVSGNVDCGVYTAQGDRVISTGSTAQAGTVAVQSVDITDTLLAPGDYYVALACDNTTATIGRSGTPPQLAEAFGMKQMASAFALPSTFVPAVPTQTYIPLFVATGRSTL